MNYRQQAERPHYAEPALPKMPDADEEARLELKALERDLQEHLARAQRWRLFTLLVVALVTLAATTYVLIMPVHPAYLIVAPGIWSVASFLFFHAWYIARPRSRS